MSMLKGLHKAISLLHVLSYQAVWILLQHS